jgi:CheY-like chemotaxis protein/HD-like signal output (HDOD) protein
MPENAVLRSGTEPRVRILVVDDEELLRVALRRTLARLGFAVIEASDCDAALETVTSQAPDVVFLDLRMPGMDGHTFLRRLQTFPAAQRPPVIAMSGHGNMDDVIEVLRWGAVDYVRKPWTLNEIITAVARALEARQRINDALLLAERPESLVPAVSEDSRRSDRLRDLQTKLRQGEIVLPATPAVVLTLRQQVDDPRSTLDDITRTVEADPRVAADILRLANVAQFSHLGRAANVRSAIGRLGLRHVSNLVQTISLHGLCSVREGPYREVLTLVWRRSVARALAMRALCELLGPGQSMNGDTAYLIGLMSDVGASLLLWVVSERSQGNLAPEDLKDVPAVMSLVHRTHEELGRALTERWGFEKLVSAAIAEHHRDVPPSAHPVGWMLGLIGNNLATRMVGQPDPTCAAPSDPLLVKRYATELTLSPPILERLAADLTDEFAAIQVGIG